MCNKLFCTASSVVLWIFIFLLPGNKTGDAVQDLCFVVKTILSSMLSNHSKPFSTQKFFQLTSLGGKRVILVECSDYLSYTK